MKARDLGLHLVLLASLRLASCSHAEPGPSFGSETNFLSFCSDDDCDEGLTCQCGVCTRHCTEADDCSDLNPEAECIPQPTGDNAPVACSSALNCEKTCRNHDDCNSLGETHRCVAGLCRSGEQRCGGLSIAAGDSTVEFELNGLTRSYLLHVPPGYDSTTALPLLLDFHPMAFDANWQRAASGYRELSDSAGFIAVWPQGVDNTWNAGPCCADASVDDFSFVTTLVRRLSTELCVDQRRIYAAGFSFGGTLAYQLGCDHSETFAAVAASSADLFAASEAECKPSRPVATIAFRGTEDTVFPYAGGPASPPGRPDVVHEFLGATGTFERWAALDHCEGEPTAPDANGCSTYETCAEGTQVTLCTTSGSDQLHGDATRAWQALERHMRQ